MNRLVANRQRSMLFVYLVALIIPLLVFFPYAYCAAAVPRWLGALVSKTHETMNIVRSLDLSFDSKENTWTVYRYDDCMQLARSPNIQANFLPALLSNLPDNQREEFGFLTEFFARWPLFQDGAPQRTLHGILASFFTGRQVAGMHSVVLDVLDELLQGTRGKDGWDVVEDLARPLPLQVIVRVLGFPPGDEEQLRRWADIVEEWFGGQGDLHARFQRCQVALQEYTAHVEGVLREIRARPPGGQECVMAQLLEAVDQGRLAEADVAPNIFFLMAAGHETTTSLIANAFLILLDPVNERQLALLRQDPSLLDACVEELLRLASPIKEMTRQVRVASSQAPGGGPGGGSFQFEGHALGEGAMVRLLNTAANLDPATFPEPHTFDIRRANARKHVAFGAGAHTCPGQLLGRLQARTVLQRVLVDERGSLGGLRLAVHPDSIERLPLDSINMIKHLPVTTATNTH